jgi:enoyl-CoA hydratase/carnithine racemase
MSAGPRTPMESHEMSTPATATDDAPVLVERLTLNRPHALNAVNAELSAAVGAALEEADHDRDVRAVVLTGAGDRAFCAGADPKALARGEAIAAPGHEGRGFLLAADDAKEGTRAFGEKRTPQWQAR